MLYICRCPLTTRKCLISLSLTICVCSLNLTFELEHLLFRPGEEEKKGSRIAFESETPLFTTANVVTPDHTVYAAYTVA